jgi:membrane protease YdiL (CAAX protease family)
MNRISTYFKSIKVPLIVLIIHIALSVPVRLYDRLEFLEVFFTVSAQWIVAGVLAAWAGTRIARRDLKRDAITDGLLAGAILGLFGGIMGGFLGALMIVEKGVTLRHMFLLISKEAGVAVLVYGIIAAIAASITPKKFKSK